MRISERQTELIRRLYVRKHDTMANLALEFDVCILCALIAVKHQTLRVIPGLESVIKCSKSKGCVDGIRYAVLKYTPREQI